VTIYKTKWYLEEAMSIPARYVHQELGAFDTWSEAVDKSPKGLFPCKGAYILKFPNVHRLTRALSVSYCDTLDQDYVDKHVDFERAARAYDAYPQQHWDVLVDYTPDYEWAWDTITGIIWALVSLPVSDFAPTEQDWTNALAHASTQQYIQWYREGHLPPPLKVVRHVDGRLVSLNRRRWLAAKAAGILELPCYYSPTLSSGRPAWERKLCHYDRQRVCVEYREGRSCVVCPYADGRNS